MKAVLLPLVFAAGVFAQGQFTINTPSNVVECQPILLTWSGGQPPYFVSVVPGNDPNGQALVDFGQQNGTSVTWLVNQQANTALGLALRDSTGQVAQSASFTVNPGSSGCVTQTASFSGGTSTAPAATGPATTPSVTSATTPAGAGSTNAASTGTTSGTSRAASATSAATSATSSSAASTNFASVSIAGVIGTILAAFFA